MRYQIAGQIKIFLVCTAVWSLPTEIHAFFISEMSGVPYGKVSFTLSLSHFKVHRFSSKKCLVLLMLCWHFFRRELSGSTGTRKGLRKSRNTGEVWRDGAADPGALLKDMGVNILRRYQDTTSRKFNRWFSKVWEKYCLVLSKTDNRGRK